MSNVFREAREVLEEVFDRPPLSDADYRALRDAIVAGFDAERRVAALESEVAALKAARPTLSDVCRAEHARANAAQFAERDADAAAPQPAELLKPECDGSRPCDCQSWADCGYADRDAEFSGLDGDAGDLR